MFGNARKAVAAAIGTLLTVLVFASDHLGILLPTSAEVIIGGLIAILTPVSTYLIAPAKGVNTPPARLPAP